MSLKKVLREALTEQEEAGITNFAHAPMNSQFITPEMFPSNLPGYMRGRWRKIPPKKWLSPSGKQLTVNAERISGGFPEHAFVYFNSGQGVKVVG